MSKPNQPPLLCAENLTHRFPKQHTEVFKNISVDIEQGQCMALIGRSGSGKTTLLHFLSGLRRPQTGRVSFLGQDCSSMDDVLLDRIRNQHMGFVYQNACLLRDFNVQDNIALVAQVSGTPYREALEKARCTLATLQIEHLAEHPPQQLSGGEKQRVAIARAIVNAPLILFADEPTGNLDQESAQHIMNTLHQLQAQHNMSIVMATHDLHIANRFDNQLVLEKNSAPNSP